jgi:Repeat of unknown function (DUF5648)
VTSRLMHLVRRPAARRSLGLLALSLVASLIVVATPQGAGAANNSRFDPGYIISDLVFYDASAMSVDAVQAFLSAKGAGCVPASDGTACLKDYRQATASRAADAKCSGAYAGASDESAATIIVKVAQACGINPRVLLVTLQKEQGLVTRRTAGSAAIYQKAMGYGCPDTAACDAQYYGFFNQVYSAAAQFRNYANNPTRYANRAGVVNNIRYHPNTACGAAEVLIRNQATASLYNYTPYQPNAAALAAGYGTGDTCSSYGNRNFWGYFTDWFGSTVSPDPMGSLDSVSAVGGAAVRVQGWTLDPDTIDPLTVHVYIDRQPAIATVANQSRPDIGAAFPGWGDGHGYLVDVPVQEGVHEVCAWALNQPSGNNILLGCRTVAVSNTSPTGRVDAVTGTESSVVVSGWALDPDATGPVQVHVYVDAQATGVTADASRPDVGAAYPGQGDGHGFTVEIPAAEGIHRVCVYAINQPAGANPSLGCSVVAVVRATPVGSPSAVYRFWGPDLNNAHFFTTSVSEAQQIVATDPSWVYEGVAFDAVPESGGTCTTGSPVYRFYSPVFQSHFYTQSAAEKEHIVEADRNWSYEGVAYCAATTQVSGTTALYRFWSPVFGKHFFTASEAEKNQIVANDRNWTYENVAYYVWP